MSFFWESCCNMSGTQSADESFIEVLEQRAAIEVEAESAATECCCRLSSARNGDSDDESAFDLLEQRPAIDVRLLDAGYGGVGAPVSTYAQPVVQQAVIRPPEAVPQTPTIGRPSTTEGPTYAQPIAAYAQLVVQQPVIQRLVMQQTDVQEVQRQVAIPPIQTIGRRVEVPQIEMQEMDQEVAAMIDRVCSVAKRSVDLSGEEGVNFDEGRGAEQWVQNFCIRYASFEKGQQVVDQLKSFAGPYQTKYFQYCIAAQKFLKNPELEADRRFNDAIAMTPPPSQAQDLDYTPAKVDKAVGCSACLTKHYNDTELARFVLDGVYKQMFVGGGDRTRLGRGMRTPSSGHGSPRSDKFCTPDRKLIDGNMPASPDVGPLPH